MNNVKVIDAICGAGKTSYAIQMINDSYKGVLKEEPKYIFVTPFISEVERIEKETNNKLVAPNDNFGTKSLHVKKLIEEENSIVMSHELFSKIDEETLSDIEFNNYVLIMDEVANVLENLKVSKKDIEYLMKANAIEVGEKGKVNWIDKTYGSNENERFRDIMIHSENENLYILGNTALFWTMNVKAFSSFKEVYILTYLFEGQIQKYYYEFHEIKYEKYSVQYKDNKYILVDYNAKNDCRENMVQLLNVYEDYKKPTGRESKLNSNFGSKDGKHSQYYLSSTWFKSANNEDLDVIRRNLNNYFRNYASAENSKIFWTTKKDVASKLKGAKCIFNKKDDRDKDNFIPMNTRATNIKGECVSVAYIYNRFMNPIEKKFFEERGIKVDQDLLAVSDLIQFLFRGCIRNNQVMNCYIPSKRMRDLLYMWMNYEL